MQEVRGVRCHKCGDLFRSFVKWETHDCNREG